MYDSSKADPELNRLDLTNIEALFDAQRRELGVTDELKTVPGITTLMLVAFGRQGIKSIEDLAGCATDDLHGWTEDKSGNLIRHDGILEPFNVSRSECEAMILHAVSKRDGSNKNPQLLPACPALSL
jgi:transcription termination/antitermination protein NusA